MEIAHGNPPEIPMCKQLARFALFICSLMLLSPAHAAEGSAHRFATRSGLNFYAGADVTVSEPGQTVFAAGGRVRIEGQDIGEIFAAGGGVTLTDLVTNRVIAAGADVDIGGTVTGSVIATGGDVNILAGSKIGGDAVLTGGEITFDGNVAGDLVASGGQINVAGTVTGDARLRGGRITLQPGTTIEGNLIYRSRNELALPEGVRVAGTVTREGDGDSSMAGMFGALLFAVIVGIFFGTLVLLFMTAVVLALFGRQVARASDVVGERPLQSLGIGMLVMMGLPFAMVVMVITIIGIPLAILTAALGLLLGAAGLVVAAHWTGMKLRAAITHASAPMSYLRTLGWTVLGLLLFSLVGIVPFIGNVAQFFAVITGFGALLLALMRRSDETPMAMP